MNVALILAHPSSSSFCATLAKDCADALRAGGAGVLVRDLYGLDFDPRLPVEELPASGAAPRADVAAERAMLASIDVFLLVYPLWFNGPPAMLKGYADRVFSGGFGFTSTAHGADPLLVGKTLVSVTTSGAPDHWVQKAGVLSTLIKGFDLHLCAMTGMRFEGHEHLGGIGGEMNEDFAEAKRAQVRTFVARTVLGIEPE